MKNFLLLSASAFLLGISAISVRAVTATGLSSFDAVEEPSVKFFPATRKFVPDTFTNITDVGGGTFRMFERYNAEWWDGDRDTTNTDRQRAEVKGLGPHQKHGDTFEYTTTWRANPGFRGSRGFCHIFQLKATNGDSGSPLVTLSIQGASGEATVEANPVGRKIIARRFPWKAETWQTVRIRIKTSPNADGELMVSVDGDAFQGKTGVAISRPESDEYRPKWGLYRRAGTGFAIGDDYVEHKNVTAQKLAPAAPAIDNAAIEIEARTLAQTASPEKALAWLQSRPASPARDLTLASIVALWAETKPAAAMTWAEKLGAGALRADAIERVFSRWADLDLARAMAWLHAHAPNAELDPLVWLFTTDTTYRYVNRAVALEAAPLIKDPELRAKAFDHVVLIWARQQPSEAAAFIDASAALTPAQKKAIVEKIRASKRPSTE